MGGEFLAIVGPSGCGKSARLRIMAGLVEPIEGRVTIDSAEVNGPNPRHTWSFRTMRCFLNELLKLWLDSEKTVVLVTNDFDEALFLADRIIVRSALPGRVRETLRVTESRPRDRGSASLTPLKRRVLQILGLESAIPRARLPVDFAI